MTMSSLPAAWTEDIVPIMQLVRTDGVGPATYQKLLHRFANPATALAALPEILHSTGRKNTLIPSAETVCRAIEQTKKMGAHIIVYGTPLYPRALTHIPDPPPLLTVMGRLELLNNIPTLGIVGARNASSAGLRITEQLAESLAQRGWCIASGLARGIDGAAHKAALHSGTTIAALAGGIDCFYPPEHRSLQTSIAKNGLLITEAPIGTAPQSQHFPRRNRLIAGLSQGCVIIEAALRSGSLITARLANEYGRTVFAAPGSPLDPRSKGGNQLLRDGAVLVENAEDILAELATFPMQTPSMTAPYPTGIPSAEADVPVIEVDARDIDQSGISSISSPRKNEKRDKEDNVSCFSLEKENKIDIPYQEVLALLSTTPVTVDELARQCQRPAAAVIIALTELELSGRIHTRSGGYALIPK